VLPNTKILNHGDYSSIANFRTKLLAIIQGIFGPFRRFSKFELIYFTNFRQSHKNYLRHPRWETLMDLCSLSRPFSLSWCFRV